MSLFAIMDLFVFGCSWWAELVCQSSVNEFGILFLLISHLTLILQVVDNEIEFKFTIDVSQFEPDELKVVFCYVYYC